MDNAQEPLNEQTQGNETSLTNEPKVSTTNEEKAPQAEPQSVSVSVSEGSAQAPAKKNWLAQRAGAAKVLVGLLVLSVAIPGLIAAVNNMPVSAPDSGKLGGPIEGLTNSELRKFYAAKEIFKKEFTVKEGLGPLFNGKSCFECHGQPGIAGGEGRDNSSTSIVNFAKRVDGSAKKKLPLKQVITGLTKLDVDLFLTQGGPSLQRRSITTEFPNLFPFEDQIDFEQIPIDAELQSPRHSPPVFGDGLIDQIADGDILANQIQEQIYMPDVAGRAIAQIDRYLEFPRASRFGWKDQHVNLLNFTAGALNIELGITGWLHHTENTPSYLGIMPAAIVNRLPAGVNDTGKVLLSLVYFQSLLAPPPRGEITEQVKRGEKLFDKLSCAVCHKQDARTIMNAQVPDPESKLPKIDYIKVKALSNKTFHPYSDFLVHDMGVELADGIPQEGVRGGEWRTTPLWGLRFKKFYLHDGRTRDLHETLMLHGGQAAPIRANYAKLSKSDREDLLAFLKSL